MAVWKTKLAPSANFCGIFFFGPPLHILMSQNAGCLLPLTFTPSRSEPALSEASELKPKRVCPHDPVFHSRSQQFPYRQLIWVWLQRSEIPSEYNPIRRHCLCLALMKIMVMNVFGALWLSHQLFLLLSLWFNIALLILLIKKLIAFASLWSPFGESIWWRLLVVNFNEALSQCCYV